LTRTRENFGFSARASRNLPWAGLFVLVREAASMITHTLAKPAPNIIGLAWDGTALWAGDWETCTLFRLDADGAVAARFPAPGRMVGMTFVDGTLISVIGDPETDDRSIHRFNSSSGSWDAGAIRCPDDTGSQLSWDGERLWLSQRYNKRVLRLTPDGSIEHEIKLPAEVTGIHWSGPVLWANMRFEKGASDVTRFAHEGASPERLERYASSFVSLAFDGSGFWMSDLRGPTIIKVLPPGLVSTGTS